jgi:hypothetical protein
LTVSVIVHQPPHSTKVSLAFAIPSIKISNM